LKGISFDMSNMHLHGSAFYDFLKLRKRFFVDGLGWDVPTDGIVEMDQYDTPLAHYSLVERDGRIIGGARCQPTDVRWGDTNCMMMDASLGRLEGIPTDLFDPDMCGPQLWEGTRLVVADDITSMLERVQCLALVVDGLMRIIGSRGGTSFITLSPLPLQRTAKMVGAEAHRLSRAYVCESAGREYAVFQTRVARALHRLEALGIDVETLEARQPPLREAV
jgi:acyl homoserine lactone synthase